MSQIKWINQSALILLHEENLAEYGGLKGIRDKGLLESALNRPLTLNYYQKEANICRLAAAYGFGIIRNHPFVDGNKRVAFLAVGLFLRLNGLCLKASQLDATNIMLALAAGDFSEEEFFSWLTIHTVSIDHEI